MIATNVSTLFISRMFHTLLSYPPSLSYLSAHTRPRTRPGVLSERWHGCPDSASERYNLSQPPNARLVRTHQDAPAKACTTPLRFGRSTRRLQFGHAGLQGGDLLPWRRGRSAVIAPATNVPVNLLRAHLRPLLSSPPKSHSSTKN